MIDLYCERASAGLWAEPLNAVTNVAYLLAAWVLWRLSWSSTAGRDRSVAVLAMLALAIAAGSALFHTLATPSARILDWVPILLFQLWFLWLYARRLVRIRPAAAATIVAAFLAAVYAGRQASDVLNGSLIYAPALLAAAGLGFHYARTRLRLTLLVAAGLFGVAVLFRTIDNAVCGAVPIGTHFLWHALSASVLYLFGRAVVVDPGVAPPGR